MWFISFTNRQLRAMSSRRSFNTKLLPDAVLQVTPRDRLYTEKWFASPQPNSRPSSKKVLPPPECIKQWYYVQHIGKVNNIVSRPVCECNDPIVIVIT